MSALRFHESAQNDSFLLRYETRTGVSKAAELPIALQGRTLVALFPLTNSNSQVYVFSQLHKAGADKPRVDLYDFESGIWKSVRTDINCVSFSKLRVEKGVLKMKCGEDYLFPPEQEIFSLTLSGAENVTVKRGKESLDLSEDRKGIKVTSSKASKLLNVDTLIKRID